MAETIRIAVVDDHPMLRAGVVRTLADESDFEVVSEGGSAAEAVEIAQQFLPDVMLLDMNMPGSGHIAIERIAACCPAVKVIMLTVQEDYESVTMALKLGARGYVLKGVGGLELVTIVRAVHDGGSYVSPSLAAKLLSDFNRSRGREAPDEAGRDSLTAREEQILRLIGEGLSNKEIGNKLDLKEKTVKHYVTNILQKLQLRNRVEAAVLLQKTAKSA
jgi:two-component system, NarL family, nitrate/nitrite response regulator NarL